MKKLAAYILTLCVSSLTLHAQVKDKPTYVANELYVKLVKTPVLDAVQYIPNPSNPSEVENVWNTIKAYGGQSMVSTSPGSVGNLKSLYRVTLKPGSDVEGLIKALKHNAQVEYAEKIPIVYLQYVPDDYDRDKQWCFKAIKMTWGTYQANPNHEINIAIVDDGIRYTHEDLYNKMMRGKAGEPSEYAGIAGVDDDGNGLIDDINGWDVADKDNNPMPPVIQGKLYGCHGTHVAGIVAADPNNGIGITSLGVNNRILCVKAASDADILNNTFALKYYVEAIQYAIAQGVDVINCSWGTYDDNKFLRDVINYALSQGIIVVAAAGNYSDNTPFYPAAYDGVIAVGATTPNDRITDLSNFGNYIDVMAPGEDILSTVSWSDNSYASMSGTSMAAPLVSSLIGLTLSLNPEWRKNIETVIKASCDNIDYLNPSYAGSLGAGRINVDNTLIYSDETSSALEVSRNGDFKIYPNPASSSIVLPFDELSPNGQPLLFKVFNVSGTEVNSLEISSPNQRIDISQLPTGIYNISTTTTDNYYQTRLLVTR